MQIPQFLTINEVLKTLRISRTTVYRRIKEGAIPSISVGGRVLIPFSYIEKLTAQAMQEAR